MNAFGDAGLGCPEIGFISGSLRSGLGDQESSAPDCSGTGFSNLGCFFNRGLLYHKTTVSVSGASLKSPKSFYTDIGSSSSSLVD